MGTRLSGLPGHTPPATGSLALTLKGFMEFWMVGTIHCKGGHASAPPRAPGGPLPPPPPPSCSPYLLDQPHLELGEEQLGEEAEQQTEPQHLEPPSPSQPPASPSQVAAAAGSAFGCGGSGES